MSKLINGNDFQLNPSPRTFVTFFAQTQEVETLLPVVFIIGLVRLNSLRKNREFFIYSNIVFNLKLVYISSNLYLCYMEKRTCKICEKTLNIEEFANAGTLKGVKYYRHLCKSCYWISKKPRISEIRKKFREYKKTLSCKICGLDDHRTLEFHHLDNKDKEFNISDAVRQGFGEEKIYNEIKKCIVVCANCHRIIHYNEDMV